MPEPTAPPRDGPKEDFQFPPVNNSYYSHLDYDAVQVGSLVPAIRGNILPPFSGLKYYLLLWSTWFAHRAVSEVDTIFPEDIHSTFSAMIVEHNIFYTFTSGHCR
jgi:hypothetical protein